MEEHIIVAVLSVADQMSMSTVSSGGVSRTFGGVEEGTYI